MIITRLIFTLQEDSLQEKETNVQNTGENDGKTMEENEKIKTEEVEESDVKKLGKKEEENEVKIEKMDCDDQGEESINLKIKNEIEPDKNEDKSTVIESCTKEAEDGEKIKTEESNGKFCDVIVVKKCLLFLSQ